MNLRGYNKCYHVIPGLWSWSDARKKCNEIDSHPLVVDDATEVDALKYFIALPTSSYFVTIVLTFFLYLHGF